MISEKTIRAQAVVSLVIKQKVLAVARQLNISFEEAFIFLIKKVI
jgi:hypothetical protein